MAIFESIEDIFKEISNFNEYTRALVTLTTAIGALVLLFLTLRFLYNIIQATRLYVCSQYCCKKDFVKDYGKWAVISGSTDGIGQSMAKELAARGMSIIVIGRNDVKLANTKVMLEQIPNVGEVETVKIDLSDASLENFDRIRQKIDPDNRDIGVLINNAGMFPDTFMRFNRFDMDWLVSIVNLNILATLHLTRMIMPGMIKRNRGLVLNVSSGLGSFPALYMGVYGATKAFLDSFTRQLQMEYSSHSLRIVLLTPGPVHTKLLTATAKITSSPIIPSADEFARSSLNALSTGINTYSGTFLHDVLKSSGKCMDSLGIIGPSFKMNMRFNAINFDLSPVPKRKRLDGAVTASKRPDGDNMENISLSGGTDGAEPRAS